jgi:hypothetical protein
VAIDDDDVVSPTAGGAGDVYAHVISELLALETTRKASIEQRGIAVITTAGGLVSLLIALSALLLRDHGSGQLVYGSRVLIVVAIAGFIAAAGLGVAANAPRRYGGFTSEDLDRLVKKSAWLADRDEAALEVAREQVAELKIAVALNNRKATYVQWAITSEVIAVGIVAASIVVDLVS